MSELKAYQVSYEGLWLGGVAIVLAYNEQEAARLVKEDPRTWGFENVRIVELEYKPSTVLFNDNGDY